MLNGLRAYLPQIEAFCSKWKVVELSVFGSVLRDDFGPGSDVDVLIEFARDSGTTLWDFVEMKEELSALFQRKVDLITIAGLRNPYRRKEILSNREVIYAA
ncbi:MAG: nucleotidyltransferase family protein [Myxococcota bacterium]|jgi:hypothetical protein|nr:nucleotidyltransferase family protein [Myxococcota bacterium]